MNEMDLTLLDTPGHVDFSAEMEMCIRDRSHSSLEGSHAWIYHYFEAAKQTKGEKKLMIDLIGPELRIGYLEGDMGLSTGAHVVIGHGGILVPEEIMPHIRSCLLYTSRCV